MRELDVLGIRVEMPSNEPILLLQEVGGSRVLPIWVGANEASAIAHALEGIVAPRPMTHDLVVQLLSLEVDGQVIEARPSDVVALAVRSGITLSAPEELLAQVGVEVDEPVKDEVERFREFLDNINPDDFEGS